MILCKYSKTGSAVFMPHLDVLRGVGMSIRRAKLQVDFSEGFNPHMQLFFNQPLPIGTESVCEYFCAYSNEKAALFMEKLNRSMPCGIKIESAVNLDKNPNIAAIITEAEYDVTFFSKLNKENVEKLFKADTFIVSYEAKGEAVSKDVLPLIKKVEVVLDNTLKLRLASGNVNLRADRVADEILKKSDMIGGYIVKKTESYDSNGKKIDELFTK